MFLWDDTTFCGHKDCDKWGKCLYKHDCLAPFCDYGKEKYGSDNKGEAVNERNGEKRKLVRDIHR